MDIPSRPSAYWPTAEQYEKNKTYTCAFWRSLPFDKLETLANKLRSVKCHANRERYAQGSSAVVVELVYDDQEIFVARLTAPIDVCGEATRVDKVARETECEVATLRLVREKTTIPVPVVRAYSSGYENELGMPYVIMSALPGSTPYHIGISEGFSQVRAENLPLLDRYVSSLAECYMQLSTIRFDRIGSIYIDPADVSKYVIGPLASNGLGPFDTAWDFYVSCAEHLEEKLLSLPGDTPEQREGRALVLWLYRLGLGLLANSQNNEGPFLLTHNDFGIQNTLVDKNADIVGFVDWSRAGAFPVEYFAAQPFDFTRNPARQNPDGLEYHRRFSAALGKIDGTASYPQTGLPGGKALSQWHSSPLAYLVGRLYPLIIGPDLCIEDPYASLLAEFVLGVEDASPFKRSVVFKEWYAATLCRVEAKRLESQPT